MNELIRKVSNDSLDQEINSIFGISKGEPLCFRVKNIHDNDDIFEDIKMEKVQKLAKKLGILK